MTDRGGQDAEETDNNQLGTALQIGGAAPLERSLSHWGGQPGRAACGHSQLGQPHQEEEYMCRKGKISYLGLADGTWASGYCA